MLKTNLTPARPCSLLAVVPIVWLAAAFADELPLYKTIPAAPTAELTPANGWPSADDYRHWTRSSGGSTSNRYSALTQITPENVSQLKVAWTYHSSDGEGNLQANAIAVGRRLFLPTAGHRIVALDAATGRELWGFRPAKTSNGLQDIPARRGIIHWPGDGKLGPRLYFTAGNWIYALDPETGTLVKEFGEDGRTALPTGGTVTGAIWKNVLIVPGFLGDVFGYDVGSGKQLWRFHTIPTGTEFGADTWAQVDKGANCWGGMSLDESRGIAYVATGSPKPNYLGAAHLGANLFSDCIIALDAATGQRLWHFQEIEHDIWDLDLPTAPNLVTVMREGKKVDAVATVSKIGHTILLDRVTGKPLFPYRLRRAPASRLPGEVTALYQPDLELPERFGRQDFNRDQITERTPEARAFVEKQLVDANMGWFEPFENGKPTAFYGMLGGSDWPGAAFHPGTGRLYVAANHLPWLVAIQRDDDPPPLVPASAGEKVYQTYCSACHGTERRGSGMVPGLRGIRHRINEQAFVDLLKTGRGAMPPLGMAIPATQQRELQDFLFVKDRPEVAPDPTSSPRYAFGWYKKLYDDKGYPGIKPPWGSLNCIDLNSGKLLWQVPLGEHEELTKQGVPKTGTENMGGATVTATGVVFCSGTRDNKLRAFSAENGSELWSAQLPLHGTAPPAIFEVDQKQYVIIAATGGGKLGGPVGDAWVAFALPDLN